MDSSELPFKEIGSDRLDQTSHAFQDVLAQLKEHPAFLIGVGVMVSAIFTFIMSSDDSHLSSKIALLPYALVVFSGILISGAYTATLKLSVRPPDAQLNMSEAQMSDACWPEEKTVKSLAAKLSELSHSQRKMLRTIRDTDGILAFQLADQLGFRRAEVVHRCSELEQYELITVHHLKDFLYSLPEDHEALFHTKTIQDILNLS